MHHINPLPPLSRRDMLGRIGAGFGTLGLAGLTGLPGSPALAAPAASAGTLENRLAPLASHFAPRAKYLIQLFMPGGPSQVDTFDHKPLLTKYAGQRPQLVNRKSLRNTQGGLFPSPFGFKQYGET